MIDLESSGLERTSPDAEPEIQDAPRVAENSELAPGNSENPITLQSDIPTPVMKRYAHHGKRRRSYTEELFRCQFTDMISRTPLICNHLLWKNKPDELRAHLLQHLQVEEVEELTDSEVLTRYTNAKKIYLEGVTDDPDYEEGAEEDE